jgi:hypothetical protein
VSSILEALRELESQRPPAAQSIAVPPEQAGAGHRAVEAVGIASIGLVVGIVAFLGFYGIFGMLGTAAPTDSPATTGTDAPAATRPAWLERADPPRARLDPKSAPADAAPAEKPAKPRASQTSGAGRVAVVAVEYSPNPVERVATLRLDDETVVRLHERESARGLEVQLIQSDGIYVKRGGEVFMLAVSR